MPDQSDAAASPTPDPKASRSRPDGTVNNQVTDAVAALDTLLTGGAPSGAAAMLGLVAANTIGLGMHNAVARQQADSAIASASIAAACARMLGASVAPDAQPIATSALIAAAEAQALSAIALLRAQTQSDGAATPDAAAALDRIATAATPVTPSASTAPKAKTGKAP